MLLVTGGLGFIGSNFVHSYLAGKLPMSGNGGIAILDKLTYAANKQNLLGLEFDSRLSLVIGDVCDAELVDDLVKKSTGIIHFAAESHVDRSILTPKSFVDTNILGTFNLLESATRHKKRIVYVSTDEVYGSIKVGEANEDSNLCPSSPYSASKAAGDLLALSYFRTFNTDVVITRCVNNFGIRQNIEKFIPTVINSIYQGIKIPVYGSGTNIRNWIDVDDHCTGLALSYENGESGEVYNFGTEEYLSNVEVCRLFLNYAGKSVDQIEFVEDRKGHDFRYAVDSSKSQVKLNWTPRFRLSERVSEIFEWYAGAKFS